MTGAGSDGGSDGGSAGGGDGRGRVRIGSPRPNEILRAGPYRLVRARHGVFLANPNDIYIGRALIDCGAYSEAEWRLLAQLLPDGGVAVEAGANIGALSVPMARRLGPKGLLWAFEPQPLVFQVLAANLALNGLVNAVPELKALGGPGASGTLGVKRLDPGARTNHGGIALERLTDAAAADRVPVVALDAAIDPPRLALLKIDVEGMEHEVIAGAAGLIARHRPALYVENHWPEESPALIAAILALDYRLWWHLPPLVDAADARAAGAEDLARITSKNMLCLPAERKTEVTALRPVAGPEDHPRHWTQ